MEKKEQRWEKAYLVDVRDVLIHILAKLRYSGQDIATIFSIDRSTVSRILKARTLSSIERELLTKKKPRN